MEEEKAPAGSVVMNPMPDQEVVEPVQQLEPVVEPEKKDEPDINERFAKLEKQFADAQKMIGKQANEIGQLRTVKEPAKQDTTPDEQKQLESIFQQLDTGELDLRDGLAKALAINSSLTAKTVMQEMEQRKQAEDSQRTQDNWLKQNADFAEVADSGALQPYLDADPFLNDAAAYKLYKADMEKQSLRDEYEQKIAAAKEEGAKLAQGAQAAGKVLGKNGSAAQTAAVTPKPFKNRQEAADAMTATLRQMRSQ